MSSCLSGQYNFTSSIAAFSPSNPASEWFANNSIDFPTISASFDSATELITIDWSTLIANVTEAEFCQPNVYEGEPQVCHDIASWVFHIGNVVSLGQPDFNVADVCTGAEGSTNGCTVACFQSQLTLQEARESGWKHESDDDTQYEYTLVTGLDLKATDGNFYHVDDQYLTIAIPKEINSTNFTSGAQVKENDLAQFLHISFDQQNNRMYWKLAWHSPFVEPLSSPGDVFSGDVSNFTVESVEEGENCVWGSICTVTVRVYALVTESAGLITFDEQDVDFFLQYQCLGDAEECDVYEQGQLEAYGTNLTRFALTFPGQSFTPQQVAILTVEPEITWELLSARPVRHKSDIEFELCIQTDALTGGNGVAVITYFWSCAHESSRAGDSCFDSNAIGIKDHKSAGNVVGAHQYRETDLGLTDDTQCWNIKWKVSAVGVQVKASATIQLTVTARRRRRRYLLATNVNTAFATSSSDPVEIEFEEENASDAKKLGVVSALIVALYAGIFA